MAQTRAREPGRTALRGMYTWDHCRRVRTSEITLTGAPHCSGRGARAWEHTAMRMHTRPGSWRFCNWECYRRVHANELTPSGAARCSGRGHTGGGTHSDANAHAAECLAMPCCSAFSMSMKNQLEQIFMSA